jgi:hypothetical protein
MSAMSRSSRPRVLSSRRVVCSQRHRASHRSNCCCLALISPPTVPGERWDDQLVSDGTEYQLAEDPDRPSSFPNISLQRPLRISPTFGHLLGTTRAVSAFPAPRNNRANPGRPRHRIPVSLFGSDGADANHPSITGRRYLSNQSVQFSPGVEARDFFDPSANICTRLVALPGLIEARGTASERGAARLAH